MPQSDISSFFPLSILFLSTFLLPALIELSFSEISLKEYLNDIVISNIRKIVHVKK